MSLINPNYFQFLDLWLGGVALVIYYFILYSCAIPLRVILG